MRERKGVSMLLRDETCSTCLNMNLKDSGPSKQRRAFVVDLVPSRECRVWGSSSRQPAIPVSSSSILIIVGISYLSSRFRRGRSFNEHVHVIRGDEWLSSLRLCISTTRSSGKGQVRTFLFSESWSTRSQKTSPCRCLPLLDKGIWPLCDKPWLSWDGHRVMTITTKLWPCVISSKIRVESCQVSRNRESSKLEKMTNFTLSCVAIFWNTTMGAPTTLRKSLDVVFPNDDELSVEDFSTSTSHASLTRWGSESVRTSYQDKIFFNSVYLG